VGCRQAKSSHQIGSRYRTWPPIVGRFQIYIKKVGGIGFFLLAKDQYFVFGGCVIKFIFMYRASAWMPGASDQGNNMDSPESGFAVFHQHDTANSPPEERGPLLFLLRHTAISDGDRWCCVAGNWPSWLVTKSRYWGEHHVGSLLSVSKLKEEGP